MSASKARHERRNATTVVNGDTRRSSAPIRPHVCYAEEQPMRTGRRTGRTALGIASPSALHGRTHSSLNHTASTAEGDMLHSVLSAARPRNNASEPGSASLTGPLPLPDPRPQLLHQLLTPTKENQDRPFRLLRLPRLLRPRHEEHVQQRSLCRHRRPPGGHTRLGIQHPRGLMNFGDAASLQPDPGDPRTFTEQAKPMEQH